MAQHIDNYNGYIEDANQQSRHINQELVSTKQTHSHPPEKLQAQKQHKESNYQIQQKTTKEKAHHKLIFDPYKKSYHDYIKIQLQAREHEKDKLASTKHTIDQHDHTLNQPIEVKHQNCLIDNERTMQNESSHIIANEDQPKIAEKNTEETVNILISPQILQKQSRQNLIQKHIQKQQLEKTIQHRQNILLDQHQQKSDTIELIKPIQEIEDFSKQNKRQQIHLILNQAAKTIRDNQIQKIAHQEQSKPYLFLQQNKKLQNHEQQDRRDRQKEQQYIKKPLAPQEAILNSKLNSQQSHPLDNRIKIQEHVKEKEKIPEGKKRSDETTEQIVNEKKIQAEKYDEGFKLSIDSSKEKEKEKEKIQKKNSENPSTCHSCQII